MEVLLEVLEVEERPLVNKRIDHGVFLFVKSVITQKMRSSASCRQFDHIRMIDVLP